MSTGAKVAAAAVAAAVGAVVISKVLAAPKKPKPYREMKLPWIVRALFDLPAPIVKHLVPAPGLGLPDTESVFGRPAHTFEQVNPELMMITYEFQHEPGMMPFLLGGLTDEKKQKLLGACQPNEVEQLKKDIASLERLKEIDPRAGALGQYFKAGFRSKGQMIVARGRGNKLLLYNLIKITPAVKRKIEAMGEVAFIVSPSSSHTLFVKSGVDAFPDAKVVAALGAQWKLAKVGVKVDYEYTSPQGLMELNRDLAPDFEAFHLPDPLCQSLLILQHRTQTLLECDVMYQMDTTVPVPLPPETEPYWHRYFTHDSIRTSPNGLLPPYRFQGLDPDGGFPVAPKTPGSKAELHKAMSLVISRQEDYRTIRSAHLPKPVPRGDWVRYLRVAWMEWLADPSY